MLKLQRKWNQKSKSILLILGYPIQFSFKDWLKCTVCHNQLSSGGRSALTIHGNGKKHKESVKKDKLFQAKKTRCFRSSCCE